MAHRSTRDALGSRLHATVDALLTAASETTLLEAVAAESGTGALARMLAALPGGNAPASATDALAPAAARAAMWREAYLARTEILDAGDAALVLGGLSTEALRKRDRAGTILALPLGSGRMAYPAWQFSDGRVVAGLAQVRTALGTESPWAFAGQLDSLSDPHAESPRTLRELLVAGEIITAVRAAEALAADGGA